MKGNKMSQFFVEITDLYGGEANYSWVTRHKIRAKSRIGAIRRLNKVSGLGFRVKEKWGYYPDKYVSRSGATCAFIVEWDESEHSKHSKINTALEI